ncbi:MAG: signal peptidase I [Firmicutes bacterium]|nr:signal peptidase I [Bacillota bacterium]
MGVTMKKRDIKNIFILLCMCIYIIVYNKIIIAKYLEYENIISPIFMIVTSFITILLLGYRKDKNKLLEKRTLNLLIYELIVYFLLTYGIGILIGFLNNSYSLTPISVIKHTVSPFVFVITSEIIRYVIISTNKDKKYPIVVITIILILLELSTTINAYTTSTALGIFRIIASALIPLTIKHSLLSYISNNTGLKIPIIYRLIMEMYIYIVPIVPNFGESFQTIVNIVLNTVIYLTIYQLINKRKYKEPEYKIKKYGVIDFVYILVILCIVGLTSGILKYSLVAVGSDSMQPTFSKGDAVFVNQKPIQEELKEKDIILFEHHNKVVIHRIARIEQIDDKVYFYTKGDANNTEDNLKLEFKDVKGKVMFVIPYIGYPNVLISEYRSK